MSAATRRFVGASRAATRIISRHRKAKAWGVEWARARDSKPWRSSSVNLSGDAKGMGIVVLLTKREGHRYCCRVSMPSHDSLCLEKTDEGFTKWTSSPDFSLLCCAYAILHPNTLSDQDHTPISFPYRPLNSTTLQPAIHSSATPAWRA